MKTSGLAMHAALHAWCVAGLYMQGQPFFEAGSKMVGNYLVQKHDCGCSTTVAEPIIVLKHFMQVCSWIIRAGSFIF